MDPSRLNDAVAARVVAWHNRHPLARRIGVAQVHSVGYVLLPFVAPAVPGAAAPVEAGAGSLRERALARSKQGAAAALPAAPRSATAADGMPGAASANFDEDFIAPLSPGRVARWAKKHGQPLLLDKPAQGPLREVVALPLPAGMQPLPVLVLTAAIEVGTSRHRVLLGAGDSAAVLGRRVSSPGRMGLLGVLIAAAVVVPALFLGEPPPAVAAPMPPALAAVAAPPASAASAAAPELAQPARVLEPLTALQPADAASAAPRLAAAAASPAAASAAPLAAPPSEAAAVEAAASAAGVVDVEPRLGRIDLPSLGLPRDKGSKAVARDAWLGAMGVPPMPPGAVASAAAADPPLRAAAPAAAVAVNPSVATPATRPQAAAPDPPAPLAAPATYAVASRLLRTRAEAEQVRDAMQGLLRIGPGGSAAAGGQAGQAGQAVQTVQAVQVEVLSQGDDFRVVGWPFGQRGHAEKARTALISRGLRVEVVAF